MTRAAITAMASASLAFLVMATIAAPAATADPAYRYWSYWTVRDGAWSFATMGPALSVPADGSVEGWHFVITGAQGTSADAPTRGAATAFTDVCGSTESVPDRKRVALVLDFGQPADAPRGETPRQMSATCVVAPIDATGADVLQSAAPMRVENGLVCGIDGYPGTECATVVDAATASVAPSSAPSSTTSPMAAAPATSSFVGPLATIGVVVIAAILGLIAWLRRSR